MVTDLVVENIQGLQAIHISLTLSQVKFTLGICMLLSCQYSVLMGLDTLMPAHNYISCIYYTYLDVCMDAYAYALVF